MSILEKNCEEYLRVARETLTGVSYMTEHDRKVIKCGIECIEKARACSNRELAASLFLIGGYYLGGGCAVSSSEKKYWDLKAHGPGGITTGKLVQKDREIVFAWLRTEIARLQKNESGISGAGIARDIDRRRKSIPVNLPWAIGSQRFVKQVCRLMKDTEVANKRESLRLVKG